MKERWRAYHRPQQQRNLLERVPECLEASVVVEPAPVDVGT